MSFHTTHQVERSVHLRQELRLWEKHFAACNDGRKPSRADIKQDSKIAAMYSEYSKIRDHPCDSATKPPSPVKQLRRRKAEGDLKVQHAFKHKDHATTAPAKVRKSPNAEVRVHTSPSSPDEESTPRVTRTFIGPTPQKDGRVLGLFDTLPATETPTKVVQGFRSVLGSIQANNLVTTPTKTRAICEALQAQKNTEAENSLSVDNHKYTRTPQSEGKRFLLDTFVTPSKRKRRESDGENTTVAATNDLGFSTPAFLRRRSQPEIGLSAVAEDEEGGQEAMASRPNSTNWQRSRGFTKRSGMARSLSTLIADMRRQEDENGDEEMAILDEIEASKHQKGDSLENHILVENSQALNILGPDGTTGMSGDEEATPMQEVRLGKDGKPWVYRKKGQKRQTKRVIMRPTGRIRTTMPVPELSPVREEEIVEDSYVNVSERLESQAHDVLAHSQDDNLQYSEDAAEPDSGGPCKKRKAIAKPVTVTTKNTDDMKLAANKAVDETAGIVKRTAKKISASAHANFRKLKIKSKGSGGGKGRFFGRKGGR